MAGPWSSPALAVPSGYRLAFDENFNGTWIDDTRFDYAWTGYQFPDGTSTTTDAISLGNGTLTLTTYSTTDGTTIRHQGGSIATGNTYDYLYGYTEARIKFNNDAGNVMAYWFDPDNMSTQSRRAAGHGKRLTSSNSVRPMATATIFPTWTRSRFTGNYMRQP